MGLDFYAEERLSNFNVMSDGHAKLSGKVSPRRTEVGSSHGNGHQECGPVWIRSPQGCLESEFSNGIPA
jgi:hypothetical protein